MFRKIAYIFLFLLSSVIFAQSSIPIIPKPKLVVLEKSPSFLITKQTVLIAPKGNTEVQYLKEIIKKQLGFELTTNTISQKTNNCIELSLNPLQKMEIDESVDLLPSFEKLESDKMWKMLNKGTHEQSEGVPEFERSDVKELIELLKKLESSIKSTRAKTKLIPQ